MFETKCAVLLNLIAAIHCKMQGFIVGGEFADIKKFPHSAFLLVVCHDGNAQQPSWTCGASVLNQDILLTAAHCLDGCKKATKITISAGNSKRLTGHRTSAKFHVKHELYSDVTSENDIGLVRMLRRLKFDSELSRVAIMKSPPKSVDAKIAGWGLIDEDEVIETEYLMHLKQVVWNSKACRKIYGEMPRGTFCASSNVDDKYISTGDSGSALMIRNYIQIGIVSYKLPNISKNLIVFTNVSFHYSWIYHNAGSLYCYYKK